jgi:uncharacterized protein with HEPN domain
MQRDTVLLGEIVQAAQRILAITTERTADDVAGDPNLHDALLWNYTVLGEAINQLSSELVARHPEVPWRDPVRVRNRIVHGYWSVDLDILVAIASDDLPTFLAGAEAVAAKLPDDEQP